MSNKSDPPIIDSVSPHSYASPGTAIEEEAGFIKVNQLVFRHSVCTSSFVSVLNFMNKAVCLILILFIVVSCQQKPSLEEISVEISALLAEAEMDSTLVASYISNDYKPIWVKSRGLRHSGEEFLEGLDEIVFDGLVKENYWAAAQQTLLEETKASKNPKLHAQLDIAISRSFLRLASDLNIGRIDPADINIEWKMERKKPTVDYQEQMLSLANGGSFEETLDQLRPANALYDELRESLQEQKENPREELPLVDAFEGKIEKGDRHEAIPAIRRKLILLEDLGENHDSTELVYDDQMFDAVKRFQRRHGLTDDGVIGGDFIRAINYSQKDLEAKILINMERLRWLPDFTESGKNKVIVNIPDFHLFYIQKDDTVLTSRAVVGTDYRQTPVFKSEMTYLVFSPTWTLPETILWEDAIPAIQKNTDYLAKNNMRVLDLEGIEVDHRDIDWGKLNGKGDFPYLIRQSPGSLNPLGKVKFMFPNEHYIYIHDSPARGLFSRDGRTFSSGCIRMEKPDEFAQILLEDAEEWDAEMIAEAMSQDDEQTVSLKESQDVWILYLTVWSREGKLEVREDVYDMDKKLAEALSLHISENFL